VAGADREAWRELLKLRRAALIVCPGLVSVTFVSGVLARCAPSIRYSEPLAESGIEPSAGGVGDSCDSALAELVIGRTRRR
jgi:hypothetical protein